MIFNFGTNGTRYFSSREGANPPRLVVEYVRRTTFTVQADTSISQAYPTQNYGNAVDMTVRRDASTFNESHALLQFNVSSVPADSTIISATLILHGTVNRALASPQAAIAISPTANLGSWTEMGVTWNSRPGDESQGDPSSTFVDGGFNYWDVTNIVQAWSSGVLLNYGFRLKPANGELGSASLVAREGSPDPQLIITYGPPPCYPATSVSINGATQGFTDTAYSFNASILPTTATPPILYTWRADEQSTFEGYVGVITYTWATTGTKTITVTASNCESSVVDTHQVVINAPVPTCTPVTDLSVSGPTEGVTNTAYTFNAQATPSGATEPVVYTWEADEQTPSSGGQVIKSYTWVTPGTKHITVTVSNCSGAAVVVQYHTIEIIPRDQLPDIVVSGMWYNLDESRAYYIIKNTGGSAAPANFAVDLTQAITVVAQTEYPEILQPGWVRSRYIDYVWNCATFPPGTVALRALITADAGGVVLEREEANNSFEDWWLCDPYPPEIVAGPFITTTEHTAQITWTTNKPTRMNFDYGRNGPFNVTTISDMTYKTQHEVSLSGLDSASIYWYRIRFTDEQGLLNTTSGAYFETKAPGTDPAALGMIGIGDYPSAQYEFWTLYADVTSDVAGVDRVSFFLDGQLIGRDYSPTGSRYEVYVSPAALGLTRAQWFAPHMLQVQAYNLQNAPTAKVGTITPINRLMTGKAVLVSPTSGKVVYIDGVTAPAGTTMNALVYGAQFAWGCTDSGFSEGTEVPPSLQAVLCDAVQQSVATMRMYLDGVAVGTHTPTAGTYNHTFTINLTGKSAGDHTLRFEAVTSDGRTLTSESTIKLVQGRGDIAIDHIATRAGNAIQVTLLISNTGTGTVYVDYVEDFARGFQVIETSNQLGLMAPNANYYVVKNGDNGDTRNRKIMVDLYSDADTDELVLAPGASFAVTYKLVPILYQDYDYYYIGSGHNPDQVARVRYRYAGVSGTFTKDFAEGDNWVDGEWIDDVVRNIIAGSDYILVTSPAGLATYTAPVEWRASQGTQRELSLLLSKMAELATYRNGVLGYLPINPCPATLDALLAPGGRWANALHPNFRAYHAGGYVLFVGEDEIIPPQGAGYGPSYSDLRYASTSGQAKPELVLGRIVGPDLGTLQRGIEASLAVAKTGVGFDRQRALISSGRGDGAGTFWTHANEIADRLNFASITLLKWTNYATAADMLAAFKPELAKGQGLVVYRGHGNASYWQDDGTVGLNTSDVSGFNLNGYHPFVFGLACSTGDYRDSYSMPEAWLRKGAGLYIGAVSASDRGMNGAAGRAFFNRWGSNNVLSVGYAFTDMARDHWGDSDGWKEWIYQYHMFGDPKFGALPTLAVNVAQPVAPDGPIGTVALTLPDYAVTTDEDGFDHLTLPDGSEWLSPTDYIVPFWKTTYTYPQGQRVQDVALTLQSGLVVTTGLHLPVYVPAIDCDCAAPTAAPLQATAAITGFYPKFEQDYEWNVFENPDGTSTLELSIYPFTYNPETTDARFYQEWNFDIDVFTTTVSIVALQPAQTTYRLIEPVTTTLVVDNNGAEQLLIVQPTVKSLSANVETALPLQALRAITGTSMLDLVITETLPAGDYYLDVTLADLEGHVLDAEVTEFTVGVAAGEATDLTAAPIHFRPGDAVNIALTFQNTGDVTLDGVAVIRVETADGVTQTAGFTHTLTALVPGATRTFTDTWAAINALPDTLYRVVGYVQYALQTSAPRVAQLSTVVPVTGVALSRVGGGDINPYTVVDFSADIAPDDASKPYSYTLDFGDGESAAGVSSVDPLTFTHAFTLTGNYTVTVTVWNDELTPPVTDTLAVAVVPPVVCVDVSAVTLGLLTTGDIYTTTEVQFAADIAPDNATKPYTYTVDYDDGSAVVATVGSADPLALAHTFAATGVYTVELAVWNCALTQPQAIRDTVTVTVIALPTAEHKIFLPLVLRNM
ncbi:MAG TPA: DNRLRE domain-containing protein [Anaerolineae bacterium]|nr:DNRLRE domain-containing protein [Anaerolineae bacterium]